MSNGLVALGGLAVAVGLPPYYVGEKKRASDSLNKGSSGLVLRNLIRTQKANDRVAGAFKPGGSLKTGQPANGDDVVAADIAGGLFVWKGLTSRNSVLAHMRSVR